MARTRNAFTIVELLLVIAIIALLIGLVIVAMGGVRNSANRTESANALRQMIAGYNAYSADHRQTLMPGYIDSGLIGNGPGQLDLTVRIAGVSDPLNAEDSAGYVWRMAPYLDNAWRTLMTDYRSRGLLTRMTGEFDGDTVPDPVYGPGTVQGPNDLGIGGVPSFGLNSIFVGGDTSHGGSAVVSQHPWSGPEGFERTIRERERLAATRLSEVRNPAQLIVFGPVARANADAGAGETDPYEAAINDVFLGYVELRAPYTQQVNADSTTAWTNQQWEVGTGGKIVATSSGSYGGGGVGAGLPIVRWGTTQYPVANLDGSTSIEDIGVLSNDMRRWSPFTVGIDPPTLSP